MKPIAIYDRKTRKRLAFLQNAYSISYTKKVNALWEASFRLPYSDPKNEYCNHFNYVELWDVDERGADFRVGLFRIMPTKESPLGGGMYVEYKLEHVLSTLFDDVMYGWHEIGGTNVSTTEAIAYVLSKQTTTRWVLDTSAFNYEFLYGWQDENLLSALFSIPVPFNDLDYMWKFDTQNFPWRLFLEKVSATPVADIRYKKNLKGLTRTEDPSNVITRLYPQGYGSGDNKLNISQVNGGVPYLESPNTSIYGVISQVWTDEKYTVAEALKATGEAMLKKLESPIVTYEYDVAEYGGVNYAIGDSIRIVHDQLDEVMVVREVTKEDVSGAPNQSKAIFGKGTIDLGDSFASIVEKQRVSETYSQGAESFFTDSLSDNADAVNPLLVYFKIPDTAVHVNDILLDVRLTSFRAYSKGVAGGGIVDKSSGGGGGLVKPTELDGQIIQTGEEGGLDWLFTNGYVSEANWHSEGDPIYWHWGNADQEWHSHKMRRHGHALTIPNHTHPINIGPHTHELRLDDHYHWINIEEHSHPIDYGIYLGPTASSMDIYLDNVLVETVNASTVSDLNLVPHMNKDVNGKVMRGTHEIKVVPNNLTRVECNFQVRLFTNAIGSGQY